jgi:hypothetical protein
MSARLYEEVRRAIHDRALIVAFQAAEFARGYHAGRATAVYIGEPLDAIFEIQAPYPAVAIRSSSHDLTFLRTKWHLKTSILGYGNRDWDAVVLSREQVTYLLGRMKRDGRFHLADAPQWFRDRWGRLDGDAEGADVA